MVLKPLTDRHDFLDAAILFLDQQWRAIVAPEALWLRRDREEGNRYWRRFDMQHHKSDTDLKGDETAATDVRQ